MIDVKVPGFRVTPHGEVDAAALDALIDTYDTTSLLEAVKCIDRLRPLFAKKNGIRDELLRLHEMAHTVLNGAPLGEGLEGVELWELVQHVQDELSEVADTLHLVSEALQPLAALAPSNDDGLR